MADPVHDAHSQATVADTDTISWSHTIGSGSDRYLLVFIGWEDSGQPTVSSITYNGVSLNFADSVVVSTNNGLLVYWLGEANLPAAGTYTISITLSTAYDVISCGADSFTGAKDQAPEATAKSTATGDVSSINTDITTLTDDAIIVDAVVGSRLTDYTADSPQANKWEIDQATHTMSMGGSQEATNGNGSYNLGWTLTDALVVERVAHLLVALEPAAPSGFPHSQAVIVG